MKKVAVVGAGFAGLAVAWNLLQRHHSVTIFDSLPIGSGASGIAAGLLHTFMGLDAKLAWQGREAYHAALQLLEVASTKASVFSRSGMLRVALTERQEQSYRQRALEYPLEVRLLEANQLTDIVPGVVAKPALWIKDALTVDGFAYLNALWMVCEDLGASLEKRTVHSLDELDAYDAVVVTAGFSSSKLIPVPVRQVKGQLLELEWPLEIPPLPTPVNSSVYCVMHPSNTKCHVGATYERNFASDLPDLEVAQNELLPKISQILPFLKDAKVLSARAGIRGSTPNHLPIAERIDERTWTLCGLGSKGLLYHAWLAEKLVSEHLS